MYYSVYLLRSLKDGTFYIGCTSDLKRRLREHNERLNVSTKSRAPWKLVYCEVFIAKKDALERERKLKHHGKGLSELKRRLKHSLCE